MSGTSLDGLDIAYCRFDSATHYQLLAAETYPYSDAWRQRLASLHKASAEEYARADAELGRLFGEMVNRFMVSHHGPVDCIASHGHTVFHQPENGFTAQIADGNAIHAATGLPVVCDFRRLDVALGGQGAPLVPIGDRLLFGGADSCINLGGIANISYEQDGRRVAYDIAPCNMALNALAAKLSMPYDRDGQTARCGNVIVPLLTKLEALDYYRQPAPKTLGKEWYEHVFLSVVEDFAVEAVSDLLRTVVEHIALRLAAALQLARLDEAKVLLTGGGARNQFLMGRLQALLPKLQIQSADPQVVDYKEAIIFALLAYLHLNNQVNTLHSVTGACCDSVGGVLIGGKVLL